VVKVAINGNSFEIDDISESSREMLDRWYRLWITSVGGTLAQQALLDELVGRLKTSTDALQSTVASSTGHPVIT
jgi:hypothetical protein